MSIKKDLQDIKNDIILINQVITKQDETIEEQRKILKTLYNELHGKQKKIQDLERQKIERCRNNK